MTVQDMINRMYAGDEEMIIAGLGSDVPVVAINAMLAGSRCHMYRDEAYIHGVMQLTESRERVMHVSIAAVAYAVLHVAGCVDYTGDDAEVLRLIHSGMKVYM